MLKLPLNQTLYLLTKEGNTGVTKATIGITNDDVSIRDYATEQNGDKHRVPRHKYFTVQLSPVLQVDCETVDEGESILFHISKQTSKDILVLTEKSMIHQQMAPIWRF